MLSKFTFSAPMLSMALGAAVAQSPRFDVASMKVLPAGAAGNRYDITPTGIWFRGYPLGFLIRWAYGLHSYQTFETVGPDWLEPGSPACVRFDIQAKTDHPVPPEQLRMMLRTLLAERMKLSLHTERKEMTVYVLSVAMDGTKLRESGKQEMTFVREGDLLHFRGALIGRLDEWLCQFVPYLIVDETGLSERYDFDLDFMQYSDLAISGPGGRIDMTASVNKALRPLGLKLEPRRRAVEVLVIDHAEKAPTEN